MISMSEAKKETVNYPNLIKHLESGNEYHFNINITPLKSKNIIIAYQIVMNIYIYKNSMQKWVSLNRSEEARSVLEITSIIENMLKEAKNFEKENL